MAATPCRRPPEVDAGESVNQTDTSEKSPQFGLNNTEPLVIEVCPAESETRFSHGPICKSWRAIVEMDVKLVCLRYLLSGNFMAMLGVFQDWHQEHSVLLLLVHHCIMQLYTTLQQRTTNRQTHPFPTIVPRFTLIPVLCLVPKLSGLVPPEQGLKV